MCKIIDGNTTKVLFYGDRKTNFHIINTCHWGNSRIASFSAIEDQAQL